MKMGITQTVVQSGRGVWHKKTSVPIDGHTCEGDMFTAYCMVSVVSSSKGVLKVTVTGSLPCPCTYATR